MYYLIYEFDVIGMTLVVKANYDGMCFWTEKLGMSNLFRFWMYCYRLSVPSYMDSTSTAVADYAAFLEKVKRTVYVDNLSPQVTESVMRTALGQFGTVKNVQFIPNYTGPKNMPCCALVEMECLRQAEAVVSEITQFPFMMSGMPRPARAFRAEVEMFDDRPIKPGRRIQCRWVDRKDPDFEVASKIKRLVRKHAAEDLFLLQQQLAQEEKLAKQQEETLKANYKKFTIIDNVVSDGTAPGLAKFYNMKAFDS